jgi:16S rRNA (cytosine1402-N4)-methyltransferase
MVTRKAVEPDDEELRANPRARSARLRVARRTAAPAGRVDRDGIGMPRLEDNSRRTGGGRLRR